jgi:hypothetical protein
MLGGSIARFSGFRNKLDFIVVVKRRIEALADSNGKWGLRQQEYDDWVIRSGHLSRHGRSGQARRPNPDKTFLFTLI